MYEELYAKLPDVNAYLRRIGMEGEDLPVCEKTLSRLVYANITHIPFENIDVWDTGACPDIGIPAVFDKVVRRSRGGYCFEINGLFAAFLRALGFEAYSVAARVEVGRNYLTPYTHRAVVCAVDGKKYYCDIGFGTAAAHSAVCLDGTETPDGFKVVKSGDTCTVFHRRGGKMERLMMFDDRLFDPVDLIPINFYDSQLPDHPFRVNLSVSLVTEKGRKQLFNNKFRVTEGDEVVYEQEAPDLAAMSAILKEQFGIDYTFRQTRK